MVWVVGREAGRCLGGVTCPGPMDKPLHHQEGCPATNTRDGRASGNLWWGLCGEVRMKVQMELG